WTLLIQKAMLLQNEGTADFHDLSALAAPEPLEKALVLIEQLHLEEALWVRFPRIPQLLFERLQERSVTWHSFEEPTGAALIYITRI
ncbi:hypothetical protein OAO01_06610, partial [Oligoflexia bacterium]|nr:hypothetical protein [Oligoflexia bacterium]